MANIDTRRVSELIAAGKSLHEIAREVEGNDDGATDAEREQARLGQALRSGAAAPGHEPAMPLWDQTYGDFHGLQKEGLGRKEAAAVALKRVFQAANDPAHPQHGQARFDPQRWRESQHYEQIGGFG